MEHKYYKLAYDAHRGTSFRPETGAIIECKEYDGICKEFIDAGNEWAIEKFDKLFVKRLSAKSRCVSMAIAGRSNFPISRMEKLNYFERNATEKMLQFIEKVRNKSSIVKRREIDYGIEECEYEINGVQITQDALENRIKLSFNEKPDQEMIATLKSRGFKWSPRNQVWQRQLTHNAIVVTKHILSVSGRRGE
jgi:hypothetical protein